MENQEAETVVVLKKVYDKLVEDQEMLDALRVAGVDNWSGYSDAMASIEESDRA